VIWGAAGCSDVQNGWGGEADEDRGVGRGEFGSYSRSSDRCEYRNERYEDHASTASSLTSSTVCAVDVDEPSTTSWCKHTTTQDNGEHPVLRYQVRILQAPKTIYLSAATWTERQEDRLRAHCHLLSQPFLHFFRLITVLIAGRAWTVCLLNSHQAVTALEQYAQRWSFVEYRQGVLSYWSCRNTILVIDDQQQSGKGGRVDGEID